MKYTSIVLLAVLSIVHSADLNASPNDENPVPAKKSTNSQDDIFRGIIEKQQELFSVNITDITKTVKQQREDLFGVLRDFAEKYALADDKDAYMLKWFNKSAQHYKNEYEEYEALVFTCEIMFDHDSRCHLEYPEDPPVKVPVNVTVEAPIEEKEEEEEKGFFGKIWSWFGAIVFASDYSYHDGGRDWTGECQTGQLQSPIMLMDFKPAFSGLSALKLNYTPFPKDQDPQTNTVQLNNVPGSLTGNDCTGKGPFTWNAKHLKFHAPAEHKIRGIKFDLEMQIVHEDDTRVNKSAVLGVIFKTGKENKFLASVIAGGQIDLAQLFGTTELKRYYAYSGSITAPPCTENVNWYIWSKVQEASEEQIKFFTALWAKNKEFAGGRGNNRAQQKTNERPVFHFNQEHSHSQHIDLNVLRREAVRVSLITIEQIEQELADKVAQIYELQNKYDSEYELASNKEHYKDNWFKNMVSSLRKTYDNYLIMVHVCEHLYPNDPRCNNIDVFDDKYDGRGVDFLSEFIEEIQDTIQNEVEMIKRSKDSL